MCAGEAFEDLVFHGLPRLPRPGEELRTRQFACTPGGGTLITAVAAARSGTAVGVVSALGPAGAARLAAESIRVVNLRRGDEPHAVSVALSTRRDRAFVTFEGVNEVLEARLLSSFGRQLPHARHLHLALGPRNLPAWIDVLDRCRRRGVTTSWDFGWHADLHDQPGFTELIGALDWVFVNEREARHYAGAATLGRALGRWKRLARGTVIKQGRRGATVLTADQVLRAPALDVAVVDTTGAGDAFNGGFLAAMLDGKDLTRCLRAGVRMGSLSTRAAGGLQGLPNGR